ncbi:hypothetical protein [Deinococcus ruber]|uniref:Lipoprotein n=1 Tax=Deinococcus ruber TaxID=1848197 RepID=A0A918CF65_9DEIO|nr:hypothetical protein [Deinococcus ruber]GGR18953.1 hypothetical protein GCM10008957_34520 [Deinococcus ruber]
MKRLVVGLVVLLMCACAPRPALIGTGVSAAAAAAELAQRDPAQLIQDAQGVLVVNGGADSMTGDPSKPGDRVVLVLAGTPDLVAKGCEAGQKVGYWRCYIPALFPGASTRVEVTAGRVLSGGLYFYRPSRGSLILVKNL